MVYKTRNRLNKQKIILLGNTDSHPERVLKLKKFLPVFCDISNDVCLFSSGCPEEYINKIKWINITTSRGKRHSNSAKRISSLIAQIKIALNLITKGLRYNIVISMGGYLAPILCSRLLGKKTIRYHAGPNPVFLNLGRLRLFHENMTNALCHRIAVPSERSIRHLGLEKYKKKISIGYFNIDPKFFSPTKPFSGKNDLIGYFGTLSKNDGVRSVDNLVEAFKNVSKENESVKLILGGLGPLYDELKDSSVERVSLLGWVKHDDLKKYLDQIKLLVLPSRTEGLATIILEAMARNTIVLATPVGSTPNLIIDCETGFIMENTTSKCIEKNIKRVLEHHNLETIADKARLFVEQKYCFKQAVKLWEYILRT